MRSWPPLTLGLLAIASVAASTTWQVTFDPGNTLDRIGQVVLQAATGDSIVVGPGTYYEHIDMQGKSLTFLATAGAQATVLDGSQAIAGRNGSIIYAGPLNSCRVRVSGFTFRGGTGGYDENDEGAGGAVCAWNHTGSAGGYFEIRDSSFLDNTVTAPAIARHGGAIFFSSIDSTLVAHCLFEGNAIRDYGGAICLAGAQLHTIRDSRFVIGRTTGHDALYIVSPGITEIIRNTFTSEVDYSQCIYSESHDVRLIDNDFIARHSAMACTVSLSGELGWGGGFSQTEVRDNRFYAEPQAATALVSMVFNPGMITFTGNTLVGCKVTAWAYPGEPPVFSNNLFVNTPVSIRSYGGGSVICNDAWPESIVDELGTLTLDRNASADPLFCNLGLLSFDVAVGSICADGHSPEGCGWIGAGRVGCGGTPVQPATWGRIKALFR